MSRWERGEFEPTKIVKVRIDELLKKHHIETSENYKWIMAVKKSDLYSTLWASCDELRGGMDASQYKDYVLTILFVKYVSDKYKGDGMLILSYLKVEVLMIY